MNPGIKWLVNHFIVIGAGLPNLGINLGTQFVFDVLFHWAGFYSLFAYLIGTGLSIEYSVLWAMLTSSEFTLLGKHWNFSHKEKHLELDRNPDSSS